MPTDIPNLWPGDVASSPPVTPVAVLREQAAHLGRLTNNVVEAQVQTTASGDNFDHRFLLRVPALGNYSYELFRVVHGVTLYPLTLVYSGMARQVADQAQLLSLA
jgi:hypothetical protein